MDKRKTGAAGCSLVAAILVCHVVGLQVHAADPLGKELANAFIGGCLRSLPQLDRIEAGAKALKWKPLEGDVARMLAPEARDVKWKSWLVDGAPASPYFFSISSGVLRGEEMAICGVTNPYAPVSEVLPHLKKVLGLGHPVDDESSAGQRTRTWEIEVDGKSALVTLMDAEPMGIPGLTLSGVMKAKVAQTGDYVNSEKRYTLQFDSDWMKIDYPLPVDLALQCDVAVCGDDVKFTSNANFVPEYARMTTADFLESAPPDLLTIVVRKIVGSFGTVRVLSAPKLAAVGDHQGYIGKYLLTFNDGRKHSVLYALTFDHGYMYHLQFYEPAGATGGTVENEARLLALINTFQLTR